MKLYRIYFKKNQPSDPFTDGGPFYVPREFQGNGRHDIVDDGVLYCSLDPVSAVAEYLKKYTNLNVDESIFELKTRAQLALAEFQLIQAQIIDLRDVRQMMKTKTGPVSIATHDREITQALSKMLYQQGYDGFIWWSALEAKWSNMTLFENRIKKKLKVVKTMLITGALPVVKQAAATLNIKLKQVKK